MSPSQFFKHEINGARPSPLKISKESHIIQKSSSSSYSSSSISSTKHHQQYQQQRHPPVIIYTHSPKIIHTKARDFMALVQKLTGLSRSDRAVQPPQSKEMERPSSSIEDNKTRAVGQDEIQSSCVVRDENCGDGGGGAGDFQVRSFSVSPIFDQPPNPYLSDIPLFTPNSANFFCSPRAFYRYPDSLSTPSNMGNSISPSIRKAMRE